MSKEKFQTKKQTINSSKAKPSSSTTEIKVKTIANKSSKPKQNNKNHNEQKSTEIKEYKSVAIQEINKDNEDNNSNSIQQTNSSLVNVDSHEKEQKNSENRNAQKKDNGFIIFLKSFTPYQIIYLLSVVVLVILFSIFLPDEMLETDNTFVIVCSVIAVVANPICELMISKQNKWNFIVSIIFIEVTESVIALSMGHIATAVVSIIFWIPIDLVSFFKWKEHPDKEEEIVTQVKRLNWWQDILIVLAICAFGFGVGYLLQLTPVAEDTYWEAFATAFGMANGILLLTRYNEQWFAWGFSLIFTAVAYILGGAYIMLITVGAMAINTIYGFVKWIVYIKKHKGEEKRNTQPISQDIKE